MGIGVEILNEGQVPQQFRAEVDQLIDFAEFLGPEVHIRTDYGDEIGGLTPWELFEADDAQEALDIAERVVHLATQTIEKVTR